MSFDDISKTLTINRLNFINIFLRSFLALKRPKLACKRATVALRLWPFHDSSVALSHRRRAQTGKRKRLYGVFRPPFPHNRQATSGVSKLNARISMTRKCRVYSYLLPITQLLISCLIQVSFSSVCLIHSAAHSSKRKT